MGIVNRFEDLKVWQNSRVLNKNIYLYSNNWKDYELKDQIRRASVSISSNIAEGYDRGSSADFIRFLYIARASATEVRSQLYLALDLKYLTILKFNDLYQQTDIIVRQLSVLISKIKK